MKTSISKEVRLFSPLTAAGAFQAAAWLAAAALLSPIQGCRRTTDVERVIQKYDAAVQQFMAKYNEAKTDAERTALEKSYPQPNETARKLLKLAEEKPESPEALEALGWIVGKTGGTPEAAEAIREVQARHLTSDKIASLCDSLVYSPVEEAEALLREFREKNPHRELQGIAALKLGERLIRSQRSQEAEQLLEGVAREYAEIKHGRGTMGSEAEAELFALRNLTIGKASPEIEGEDLDGKRFKLSDYRGKVVVLDFWGDW